MKNISLICMITIVAIITCISGCVDDQNVNNTSNQTSGQNATVNNQTNPTVAISPAEAQKTAQKFIEQPNATAGVPFLINDNGKTTYVVPVILNGNQVGEILIDAQSGENMGGAGGVSSDTN